MLIVSIYDGYRPCISVVPVGSCIKTLDVNKRDKNLSACRTLTNKTFLCSLAADFQYQERRLQQPSNNTVGIPRMTVIFYCFFLQIQGKKVI